MAELDLDAIEADIAELGIDEQPERKPAFWTVAVYLCDRAFGGPEEGGWWFDTGERIDRIIGGQGPQVFTDIDMAYAFAEQWQERIDAEVNDDGRNRDLGSVCCVGRYCAEVHEGYPPPGYPDRRPHYE